VSKLRLTGSDLRAEGVVEVGACAGNLLYVKTTRRLCLFYADQVANYIPKISPWGLRWAQDLLDRGHTTFDVSHKFGLHGQHALLWRQLVNAGLARPRQTTDPRPTNLSVAKKQNRFMRRGGSSKAWVEEFED
jgi:hypothetical protein